MTEPPKILYIHASQVLGKIHARDIHIHLCENECELEFDVVLTWQKDILVMFDVRNASMKQLVELVPLAEKSVEFALCEYHLSYELSWVN